jgi:histidine ammonia-lyase
VLANVQRIVGLELLVGAQALDFRLESVRSESPGVRPGLGVSEAHARIRSVVPHLDHDRQQTTDIDSAVRLVRDGALVDLTAIS